MNAAVSHDCSKKTIESVKFVSSFNSERVKRPEPLGGILLIIFQCDTKF